MKLLQKAFPDRRSLAADIPASIVVFLVALPLCLGIALASGAPLFGGIIAGIIGGIVVGMLSGSSLGVSGPAAGLAVIVLSAIDSLGGGAHGYSLFLATVVLAGFIQLGLGFLKAGIIAYYFPSAVIKGMLSAIGIIIILKQVPFAVGYTGNFQWDAIWLQTGGQPTSSNLNDILAYLSPGSIIVSLVSMGILVLWEQRFMKRISMTSLIQGPLVVVITGILLHSLLRVHPTISIAANQLVELPVAYSWHSFTEQLHFPDFTVLFNPAAYTIAITLAVIASLETLLSVYATDRLDPERRVTPANRELKAQGIGNIISGLLGGLPITQVIARSSVNIQSGGKTKVSVVLHGVLILISVITIPSVLNMIPLASLAAILIMVGYKLAKPSLFRQMYKEGREKFIPFIVTVVAIVFTDLLYGILIGLAVRFFFVLRSNYRSAVTVATTDGQILIQFNKDVTFVHKADIMRILNSIPNDSHVVIDGSKASLIDHDIEELIQDFRHNCTGRGIKLEVIHFHRRNK